MLTKNQTSINLKLTLTRVCRNLPNFRPIYQNLKILADFFTSFSQGGLQNAGIRNLQMHDNHLQTLILSKVLSKFDLFYMYNKYFPLMMCDSHLLFPDLTFYFYLNTKAFLNNKWFLVDTEIRNEKISCILTHEQSDQHQSIAIYSSPKLVPTLGLPELFKIS